MNVFQSLGITEVLAQLESVGFDVLEKKSLRYNDKTLSLIEVHRKKKPA